MDKTLQLKPEVNHYQLTCIKVLKNALSPKGYVNVQLYSFFESTYIHIKYKYKVALLFVWILLLVSRLKTKQKTQYSLIVSSFISFNPVIVKAKH